MTPLIVVLGIAGAILILAGLIGGGFTFSGSYMPNFSVPKVGNWVRLPCCTVGAVLVVLAMVLGLAYSPLSAAAAPKPSHVDGTNSGPQTPARTTPAPSPSPPSTTTPPTPAPADTSTGAPLAWGTIAAPQGYNVNVYEQPYTSSPVAAEVYDGASVGIVCTAQGDVVTNPDNGYSSSLWDGTSDGFIPDAYVDTGTDQATMPSC